MSLFVPFGVLSVIFQFFFVTAGRPNLGLFATVLGGVTNMVLDYVLIVPANLGIAGAAVATGLGFTVPSLIGLAYFFCSRKGALYFQKPVWDGKLLLKTCTNGSSEMVSNLSTAVITFLFNWIMMRASGEDGVAAVTIVFYAQFLFTAIFLGYTSGVAPLFSYNYGARDTKRLKKLFRLSLIFVAVCSVLAYSASIVLAAPVVRLFAAPSSPVYPLAVRGMYLFAFGFLFMGANIFASGLFTALGNGKISAILSFLRTFVLIVAAVFTLPLLIGVDGVWLSIPAAELLALVIAVWFLIRSRSVYQY